MTTPARAVPSQSPGGRDAGHFFDAFGGTERFILVIVAAILAAGFGLRVFHLDAQSIWADEIYTVLYTTFTLPDVIRNNIVLGDPQPPLYYLIVNAWVLLTSDGEFALRFPAVAAGAGSIAAIFALGSLLAGRRVAVIAALILAVNPYHLWFAQETRSYTLTVFLVLVALWLFARMLRPEPRWWHFVAYLLVATAAMASHYYAFLLLGFTNIFFVVWLVRHRAPWRRWYVTQLGFIVPYLPWLPLAWERWLGYRGENQFQLDWNFASQYLREYSAGWFIDEGIGAGVTIAMLALAVAGVVILFRRNGASRRYEAAPWFLSAFLLLPVLLTAAALLLTGRNLVESRYFIIITPAYYLLAAVGLSFVWGRSRLVGAVSLAAVSVAGVAGIWPYFASDHFAKADNRAAAAYIQANEVAGEVLILRGDVVTAVYGRYYDGVLPLANMESFRVDVVEELVGLAAQYPSAWLVPYGRTEQDLVVQEWLDGNAYLAESRWFTTTKVRRYVFDAGGQARTRPASIDLSGPVQLRAVEINDSGAVDGGFLLLRLGWELGPGRILDQTEVSLRLIDLQGHTVSEQTFRLTEGVAFGPGEMANAGVTHRTSYALSIPEGTLPGRYTVAAVVRDLATGVEVDVLDASGAPAGIVALLGRASLDRSPEPLTADIVLDLGGGGGVVEYRLATPSVLVGEPVRLTVTWQLAANGSNQPLSAWLVAPDGGALNPVLAVSTSGNRPLAGRPIRDFIDLPTQGVTEAGSYGIQLRLGDNDPVLLSLEVEIQGRLHAFDPPSTDHPIDRLVGERIRLVGFSARPDLSGWSPGSTASVELVWEVLEAGEENLIVFVQLIDPAAGLVAQSDNAPGAGSAPTAGWLSGEFVSDGHTLTLPESLAPGSYRLIAGMYRPGDNVRLSTGSDGNFVDLGMVNVR